MANIGKCCPHNEVIHRPYCRICGDQHEFVPQDEGLATPEVVGGVGG